MTTTPLLQVNGSSQNQLITLDENGRGNLRVTSVTTSLGGPVRQVPLLVADDQLTIALYEESAALSLLTPILELKGVNLDDVRAVLGRDVRSASAISPQVALASNILQSSVADNSKAAALFDVFASLPEGRHLIPHRQVMIEFLKGQLPSEFISGYIDELHSVILQRQSSGLSEGYKRMVGVLVMSEMIAANSASLDLVYQSVRDAKDLQLWLDWMAMPANGWALFQPPTPDVEQSCTSNVEYVLDDALKVPLNPCRLNGAQFGEWLSDFATISPDFASDPGALREQLSTIYESLASSNYEIRTSLFGVNQQVVTAWDPTSLLIQKSHAALPLAAPIILRLMVRVAMKLAVKLGKNAARNLVKFALGKSNYRVHPMVFLLAAGYLYDQIESGALKTVSSDANAKFWSTMGLFAGRLALENGGDGVFNIEETLQKDGGYNCRILNFSHGNMYEIVMIAFYQAMGKKIVELDRQVKVPLYGAHQLIRKPDIELKGASKANIWIELKSVQAAPSYRGDDDQLPYKDVFLNRFPVFNAVERITGRSVDLEEKRSGKNEYHKQFVLDRIATYGVAANGQRLELSEQMHWRFQKWKPKLVRYKRPVAGRTAAGNGYPMTTRVRGHSGTYLGLLKEHFASPPVREADFRKILDLDRNGINQKAFETVEIPVIFRDPVVQDQLDALEDIDEYFIQQVLGRMGYSPDQLQQIKRYVDSLDAIQQRIEAVESWVDKIKAVFHLDIEDELMEAIQEKGEELAEKVGFGGSCESTY